MIDIKELRVSAANSVKDLALLPSEVLELLDRLEAAEKERDSLRADKATLQQMTYSLKDRLEVAEKSDAESIAMYRKARDERDDLRAKIPNLTISIEYLSNLKKSYEELIGELQDERDNLRAKVERMEKQEPIGEIVAFGESLHEVSWIKGKLPPLGANLYALPGAQGEEE